MTINNNTNESFIMIPNNVVQNITSGELEKPSYIQLYGKRTIAYLQNLLALQNVRKQIHFNIDMILWMQGLEKKRLDREKNSLKEFLKKIQINSLISFSGEVDFKKSSEFMIAELNIYEYKVNDNPDDKPIIVKFFMLMDSEYNTIMDDYDGKLDKYNLLNLFCNIKSRIKRNKDDVNLLDKESEVAYPSYERIKEDIFIESDKTLKEYIDALVKLDLIHYGYAGDMKMQIAGQTRRRKSNFTYALSSNINWEVDLENSISALKQRKRNDGWTFITKQDEILADDKRSITQKINMLEKMQENNKILTQSQKREYAKLKRQQDKWKSDYENADNVREIEEAKLLHDNPDKKLWEIYRDIGHTKKALRALKDAGYSGEDIELLGILDGDYDEPDVVDNRKIAEIKGYGLQNKKPVDEVAVTIEEEHEIFKDMFDEDNSEDYSNGYNDLTDEELQGYYETINANNDQIPEETLRHMREHEYAKSQWEDELREMQEENY